MLRACECFPLHLSEGSRDSAGVYGRGGKFGSCVGAGLICAIGRLDDINKNCLDEFRKHWQCLDNNNQQLWHCRRPEQLLNACVFDKLVRLCLPYVGDTLIKTFAPETGEENTWSAGKRDPCTLTE